MFQDPTFFGWLTTGLYVAAAVQCAIAARSPANPHLMPPPQRKRLAIFWWLLTIGLALLAINKQLDLQTTFTNLLRDAAEHGGWYGKRRMWQAAFVFLAVGAAALSVWGVHRLLGRAWRKHWLALAGVGLLAVYLILRIADIERLGEVTGLPLAAHRVRSLCEWAGLLLIGIDAWRAAVIGQQPPGKAGS